MSKPSFLEDVQLNIVDDSHVEVTTTKKKGKQPASRRNKYLQKKSQTNGLGIVGLAGLVAGGYYLWKWWSKRQQQGKKDKPSKASTSQVSCWSKAEQLLLLHA